MPSQSGVALTTGPEGTIATLHASKTTGKVGATASEAQEIVEPSFSGSVKSPC